MSRYYRIYHTATEAAQRRRRVALWLEHFERLERTPARSDEERIAKQEALHLMRQAYPGP